MQKIITIIRGVSGSGKTTLATRLLKAEGEVTKPLASDFFKADIHPAQIQVAPDSVHLEADMYFTHNGEYDFAQDRVRLAHEWCQKCAELAMQDGISNIIIANTGCADWEVAPYMLLAKEYGYTVNSIITLGTFQNVHNVPDDVLQRQMEKLVTSMRSLA